MTIKKISTLLLLTSILLAGRSFGQIKDVTKIAGTYNDFNKALEKLDSENATKYLSLSTIEYFRTIIPYVKGSSESVTDSLYLRNKKVIVWLKTQIHSEGMDFSTGVQLLNLLFSKGIFQKLNLNRFHPGTITIMGEKAKASLTTFSTAEKTECFFIKEDKKWKFDLSSVIHYLVETSQNP